MKMKLFTKRNIIIMLFVFFLFLRLFVSSPYIAMGGDALKYIHASKHFPYSTGYNDQLYLLHPPFYPYLIHLFDLFVEDHIAEILISLISSVITFFVLYRFFMMLTKNFNLTLFILLFYTLSVSLIVASRETLKEAFVIMLIFLTIHLYIKGIKFDNKNCLIKSSIVGSILAVTSDHVVFIFPALILSYIFFNSKQVDFKRFVFPNIKYLILPLLLIFLFYGSWSFVKFYHYSINDYYPNGYSGIPLDTRNVSLLAVIDPQFFENYEGPYYASGGAIRVVKRLTFNFGYMFDIEPFSIPRGLNFTTMKFLLFPHHIFYMFVIYLPLFFILFYGLYSIVRNIIRTKKIHNNVNLYVVCLFLLFAFPLTQKLASPRFILTSYFFFFYFISYGLVSLFDKKWKLQIRSRLIPLLMILLLLLTPCWYYANSNFVLLSKKVVGVQNTGDFINANLPRNVGIMAQPGYTNKLNYLTENRLIGLYPNPEKLLALIDYFDISYIVAGRYYTYDKYHMSKDSVEYVMNNPQNFEHIATIQEDYSQVHVEGDPGRTDEVYIYKVLRNE